MSEGNGVPKWVIDAFDRNREDREEMTARIQKLEDKVAALREWRQGFLVIQALGIVLLNGAVTLLILSIAKH